MGFLENLEAAFDMPSWDYVDPDTGDAFRIIKKTPFLGESR